MERDTVNDVFPEWASGGGIFSALQACVVPWSQRNIHLFLDAEYHGNFSGDKLISPLVDKYRSETVLSVAEKGFLAFTIAHMFGNEWGKEWSTRSLLYNPIENYNMTEQMTDDETVMEYGKIHTRTDNLTHAKTGTDTETPGVTETRTDNLTHAKTGTDTETPGVTETRTDNLTHGKTGTETVTPDLTNNTSNSVFGFNSATAVDTGASESTSTGNTETEYDTEETNTGTQTVSRTGNNQTEYDTEETDTGTQTVSRIGNNQMEYDTEETDTGTVTDSDTGSDTHTRNYSLTRSGNIGVTTSQQMIQSERDLWMWNYFYEVVFPDIDRILTLRIY